MAAGRARMARRGGALGPAARPAATAGALALFGALLGCAAPPAAPPSATAAVPAAIAVAAPASAPAAPEAASGWTAKPGWKSQHWMVAAANPLATEAGFQILADGGSALDAAIAVQMVLCLVEPQSSGIAGGAFLMHWDGRTVQAWDGRETAPAGADPRLFIDAQGKPLPYAVALYGGRAVATPGVLAMLEAAHRSHGRLPWARLFAPAIELAEQGFALSPRLHALLAGDARLHLDPQAGPYFYAPDGQPFPVGHLLRNPALAAVLRQIAAQGSAAFYGGPVAADIVRRVAGSAVPGSLSLADLAAYRPRLREPICTAWLAYSVCGFPPPSSGHLAIMQTLGMLADLQAPWQQQAQADAKALAQQGQAPDAAWLHLYEEASRLAFADRARYVADPDFVAAPGGDWTNLLRRPYLAQRAALIGPNHMPAAPAGEPGTMTTAYAPMPDQPEHGTSHISVVDGQGNALAMTTTIESAFGSHLMSDGGTGLPGGFLLNNEMTDFSSEPTDAQGRPVANAIEPGKRPRSSMSPTLVFDRNGSDRHGDRGGGGRLVMSLGSPGGPVIIHFTAKTLIGALAWGLAPQPAIDLPNFGGFGGPMLLEQGRFPAATLQALSAHGDAVIETELTSGLQAIERDADGWIGGADPRREGIVMGR